MLAQLGGLPAEVLDRPAYHARRRDETQRLTAPVWKLERSQYFREPADDPSWQAFVVGDWEGTLKLFEEDRDDVRSEVAKYRRQGSELRRLRIVEKPLTAYVRWELHWFKILAEEGTAIRVLDAGSVRARETRAPLPEVVADEHAVYQVRYDADWQACGARRIADPAVIAGVTEEIAAMWAIAEPFTDYFGREVVASSH